MRAIGTVASAIALVAEGPRLTRGIAAEDPAVAAKIDAARSTLRDLVSDKADAQRVGLRPGDVRSRETNAMVRYDQDFAARQAESRAREILGRDPVTPKGRQIMTHAAERMVDPPPGRARMTPEEIDRVLDEGDQIKKGKVSRDGRLTITVKHNGMDGAPEVAIDEGGNRVVTAIKRKAK